MERQEVSAGGAAPMCANGCGYYGSAANKNCCSKCFKDLAGPEEKKTTTTTKPSSSKTPIAPPPVNTVTAADEATSSVTEEVKQKDEAPAAAILCVGGCGFYGSAERRNMCSKCYIDGASTVDAAPKLLEKIKADNAAVKAPAATEDSPVPAAEEASVETPKAAPNRCATCRKKVGLLGFGCRCGGTFCSLHRYAEKHSCDFDFKKADREQLAKNNPLVLAPKIDKI